MQGATTLFALGVLPQCLLSVCLHAGHQLHLKCPRPPQRKADPHTSCTSRASFSPRRELHGAGKDEITGPRRKKYFLAECFAAGRK